MHKQRVQESIWCTQVFGVGVANNHILKKKLIYQNAIITSS